MINLGNKIFELRTMKNLSQNQLAKLIGVSQKAIDFWEKNTNEPKATYIAKIAKLFDVSADYLLGLENFDGTKTYINNSFNNSINNNINIK